MAQLDPRLLALYAHGPGPWFADHAERPIDPEFLIVARRHLGAGARFRRMGGWVCVDLRDEQIEQGWKIHVSATNTDAAEVLERTVQVLAPMGVDFKFQADAAWLSTTNGRSTPRGNGCKFITAFPLSEEECREALERLHSRLDGFEGPRILSDRRFRDSRVVHYRYGGHRSIARLDPSGGSHMMMRDPRSGELVADERPPYWSQPDWIDGDPFADEAPEEFADFVLGGRFRVEAALRFTNGGGVYIGTDLESGRKVLIKEARPGTDTVPGSDVDSIGLRRNEYEFLDRVRDAEVAVEPIAFFLQEDHAFLVTEYLERAVHLQGFVSGSQPPESRATAAETASFIEVLLEVWRRVAGHLELLHDRGVVHGDVSATNVMLVLDEDGAVRDVRLIDFEAASPPDRHDVPCVVTPGFSPPNLREDRVPRFANDVFAFGAVVLSCLSIATEPAVQDRDRMIGLLRGLGADMPLPEGLTDLIGDMTEADPRRRPTAAEVRVALERMRVRRPARAAAPRTAERERIDLARVVSGITAAATPGSDARCFPADPILFHTNPFSIAYGAAGVLRALAYLGEEAPPGTLSWLLERGIDPDRCPPGLYTGIAGIAWACLDLGLDEYARDLMDLANRHPLVGASSDVFAGDAGIVLADLHFWDRTSDEAYLEAAVKAAVGLQEAPASDLLGFAHGAGGSALALLYAGEAAADDGLSAAGLAQMLDCIGHARAVPGGFRSMPESRLPRRVEILSPYWSGGSAGVGAAALRFATRRPEEALLAFVDDAIADSTRKYTFMPGHATGLAGLGDFLLDAYRYTGRTDALEGARTVADGIALFARTEGPHVLFPGSQLLRHSTDFSTGAAGVAMFLHRLESIETAADPGPVQMLPRLLAPPAVAQGPDGAEAPA
ncbi:class III lanthionine synthetase LanKC [Glycomyces paridis]|uniref:Protein kinase domain-containing protein n=1 Tax=Glycomyces paridis TaxID=2126555 RepID=A0A4V4HPE3_9ACTN|nr:class III lanthionine synthetase LanKC [Glycomyces paridis]THV29586.1 hypothetical protein E9998_08805 [Glycomyces paridis]